MSILQILGLLHYIALIALVGTNGAMFDIPSNDVTLYVNKSDNCNLTWRQSLNHTEDLWFSRCGFKDYSIRPWRFKSFIFGSYKNGKFHVGKSTRNNAKNYINRVTVPSSNDLMFIIKDVQLEDERCFYCIMNYYRNRAYRTHIDTVISPCYNIKVIERPTSVINFTACVYPEYKQVSVHWKQPAYPGSSALKGYKLNANKGSSKLLFSKKITKDVTSIMVNNTEKGIRYYFFIMAENQDGICGPESIVITAGDIGCYRGKIFVSENRKTTTVSHDQPDNKWNKDEKKSNENMNTNTIVIIGVPSTVFVGILLSIFLYFIKKRRRKKVYKNSERKGIGHQAIELLSNSESECSHHHDDPEKHELTSITDWEVSSEYIHKSYKIGEGHFAEVFMAKVEIGLIYEGNVAVKCIKEQAPESYKIGLLEELTLMKSLLKGKKYRNIVALLGCVTKLDEPLMLIMEYMCHGSLRRFLRSRKYSSGDTTIDSKTNSVGSSSKPPLSYFDLLAFSCDVACGMAILEKKNIIHRDMAARNVLVGNDSEGYVSKIADFGMAKSIADKEEYIKSGDEESPCRWMALEAITNRRFTTKSDVWSFGVLLFEIFTTGGVPYDDLRNERLGKMLPFKLESGWRMKKPCYATDEIYSIMLDCWWKDPESRPSFEKIWINLTEMKERFKATKPKKKGK